jgi:hypothetical protein
MKEAVLVIGRPTTEQQELLVKKFGKHLSQYGMDVHLMTNYPATRDTQKEFKGCHFYDYNPKGDMGILWTRTTKYTHIEILPNWCLAVTSLYYNGLKLLKSLGYNRVYAFNYDITPDRKLEEFIESSREYLNNGKQGVFVQYPRALKQENFQPIFEENVIDNEHFAGNVDFLIQIFNNITSKYFNQDELKKENPHAVCEHVWEYHLRDYPHLTKILPRDKALKGTQSVIKDNTLGESKIFYGFNHTNNQATVHFDPPLPFPIEFYTPKRKPIVIFEDDHYEIDLKLGEELNISYYIDNKTHTKFLFKYNNEFKETYFWKDYNTEI